MTFFMFSPKNVVITLIIRSKGRRYNVKEKVEDNTLSGTETLGLFEFIPDRVYYDHMSILSEFIKTERKKAGLTQEEFAIRSGLGLRFVRELERGKETVRLDKVNQALAMFGMEAVPGKKNREDEIIS